MNIHEYLMKHDLVYVYKTDEEKREHLINQILTDDERNDFTWNLYDFNDVIKIVTVILNHRIENV